MLYLHTTVVSRENIGCRLTVLLYTRRDLRDVRTQRVQTTLSRGHTQQYVGRREREGREDVWGQQRMSL